MKISVLSLYVQGWLAKCFSYDHAVEPKKDQTLDILFPLQFVCFLGQFYFVPPAGLDLAMQIRLAWSPGNPLLVSASWVLGLKLWTSMTDTVSSYSVYCYRTQCEDKILQSPSVFTHARQADYHLGSWFFGPGSYCIIQAALELVMLFLLELYLCTTTPRSLLQ